MVDRATREAWEAGPFAAVLRGAQADREKKAAEAAQRPAMSAAVFVDEDVSRDSVEREALKHLAASAPDAETGHELLRMYAQRQLRKTFRGVDWEQLEALRYTTPCMKQLPLPRPVGNGKAIEPAPKKRTTRAPRPARPKFDYALLTPFPGWPAAAARAG